MKPVVYLIEDDEDSQNLMRNALRKAGFTVTTYGNGFPVLEMINNLPDVFVLDIGLPGVDGLQVCRWLKAQQASRDIPVIFLSGKPFLKEVIGDAPCNDYLQKPFLMDHLVHKINSCLMRV